MTTISGACTWCSVIPRGFTDFPVRLGRHDDSVIITSGPHLIRVVQVANQETIKSWSSKQLFSFTCPSVFNPVQKQYCVVQNKNLLIQWTEDAESIVNSHKIKFTEKIYTILDFRSLEPVVVFSKGDCQILSKAIETRKETKHTYVKEADICWAAGHNDTVSYYVVLITKNKQSLENTIHWLRILKSDGVIDEHRCQSLKRDGASPLSWCLKQDGEKALIVLWSDGELHSYNYEKQSKNVLKIHFVEQNYSTVACCLNDSYIAVATVPRNKDPILEIWDTNFSIIKEKMILSFLSEGVQMNYVNGMLFLLNVDELRGIFCNLQSSSLASIIGSAQPLSRNHNDISELVVKWTNKKRNDDFEEVNMECEKFQDILHMESTGQTLPYLWKQLFSNFSHKSDLSTLKNALERWKHVPEKILANILEFCISARNEIFTELIPESIGMDEDCPFSYSKALFLNKLLSLSFSHVFIHKHLQAIPFQHIVVLLQYLLYLLKSEERMESIEKRPSVQIVCCWLCILFDAHFSNFILSRDKKVHQLILHLTEATKTMLHLYKDLDNLEELLIFAQEKLQPAQARLPPLYCIEMLCI